MMLQLVGIELFKIFKRPRTYISFAAIAAIVSLIQLAMYADGESYVQFGMQGLQQSFDINGRIVNGYFICFLILQTLLLHVPLLIALVAGDMVAGEANMGTLRLLLTKPVSRVELALSKFLAAFVYTVMLLVWMALLSLILSLLLFGEGDMINLKSTTADVLYYKLAVGIEGGKTIYANDILWRFFAAFGFAILAMTTITALAFLLSIFAENSIGPIVTTMSIVIVFTILTSMDIPFFNAIRPLLFTQHMIGWKGYFDYPKEMSVEQYVQLVRDASYFTKVGLFDNVQRSAFILLAHIFIFVSAAVIVFKRKDILS